MGTFGQTSETIGVCMVTQSSLSTLLVVDLLPCAHWVHPAEPASALNDPAGQGMQGPPLGPEYPAIHEQMLRFTFPKTGAVECSGQSRQSESKKAAAPILVEYMSRPHRPGIQVEAVVAAVTLENVPTAHGVHIAKVAAIASEYVPALHGVHVAAIASEYVPALHGVHVALSVAAIAFEYVPATHGVHVAVSASVASVLFAPWYEPGAHGRRSRRRLWQLSVLYWRGRSWVTSRLPA